MASQDGAPTTQTGGAADAALSAIAAGAPAPPEPAQKYMCFRLHSQELAVPIAAVKETLTVPPITPVFLTPPCFAGIINLRGDIVAVLDLASLLGLPQLAIANHTRIVVCKAPTAGQRDDLIAGLLVDELTTLCTLERDQIAPPPPTLPARGAALLTGVVDSEAKTALQVLDVAQIFAADEVCQFRTAAAARR